MPPSKRKEKEVNWAIKKGDSEPLLRWDIQWAVLDAIFQDRTFQFTAPVDQSAPSVEPIYLNFDQLYLEAILSSMKTTQHLKNKLIEDAQFALNYCKLCLLINVGRVNTTVAFYPGMKTALRTYHPIPALQNNEASRKELTDSPRMKSLLKACCLDWEVADQPANLKEIAQRAAAPDRKRGPPTTVVTAVFHLFADANWASERYFPAGTDLWDIFYPSTMPAQPRAAAFLTLLHRILEQPTFLNDWDAPTTPIPLTPPIHLVQAAAGSASENVDTPDELAYVRDMKAERAQVVRNVPAIQQREAEVKAREKRTQDRAIEKEEGLQGIKKRRAVEPSHAKKLNSKKSPFDVLEILPPTWREEDWDADHSNESSLPSAWAYVKHEMLTSRDPDYDSDEEYTPWTILERRRLITFPDAAEEGKRVKPNLHSEYQDLLRLQAEGADAGMIGTGDQSRRNSTVKAEDDDE